MTEKHNTLKFQMDKILNDANAELRVLNQKLNGAIRTRISISSADPINRHANRPGQAKG